MKSPFIYLDNAASTPISETVFDAMSPVLRSCFGNPSSQHRAGKDCRRIMEAERREMADCIGCSPDELFFTSGGTESDNLAIFGAAYGMLESGKKHIICSSIEHKAVLEPVRELQSRGFEVSFIGCDLDGKIQISEVLDAIQEETGLISVGLVNNETGVIQSVQEIAREITGTGILLHSDAVQALTKIPLDCTELGADLLSFSAHKIHGPKGIGALYIKHGRRIHPLLVGGAQERNLRSGTENVPGIVGFGMAVREGILNRKQNSEHVVYLKNRLSNGLLKIGDVKINGDHSVSSPYILNVSFPGTDGGMLHKMLIDRGLCVSSGSACSSQAQTPSHVLTAMGLPERLARSSVRFSFSRLNTQEEVDTVVENCSEMMTILKSL